MFLRRLAVGNANRFEIRIAGFGGQGVVTIGRIIGTAFSVYEEKNSVNTQSYGPESRGGACKSEVVVSDEDIYYPYVRNADVLIALSQVALDTYRQSLKEQGILFVDPGSIRTVEAAEGTRVYEIPAAEIAYQIGSVKYQNAVAVGALYALISDRISASSLKGALQESVPPKTRKANLAAFEKGIEYMRFHYPEIA